MTSLRPEEMPPLDARSLATQLDAIVALGNRFAGTEGEHRARDAIVAGFRAAGLEVVIEEFPFVAYVPVSASCTVPEVGWALRCAPLQSTADGVVEAEAVYIGAGTDEDIAAVETRGIDLAGKIVVAHSYLPFLVAPRLAKKGIAGLVNVAETPDGLVGNFTAVLYPPQLEPPWEGHVLSFPGVTVETGAARRLIALMTARPLRIRVEHRARYAESTSANILAEIAGDEAPGERVIIGGHYDTQLEGPGAADNAAGIATLLELARVWSGLRTRRTIVLAAWGVEELGIWGSTNYVVRHAAELDSIVAMVNLDAMGLPYPGTRMIVADPAIADYARAAAAEAGFEVESELEAADLPFADYAPFVDGGVPACWLWRYPPQHPYYHSAGDTLRTVDLDHVLDIAKASAWVSFRLATDLDPGIGRARPSRRHFTVPRPRTAV